MANTKVTTGVIKDDAVGADQLASNAVVTASIADNAVTTAKISDDAILTAKISNSAITNAKMSANSVDSDQYVDGSIDTAHIADSQITSAKLDTNIAVSGTLTLGSHLIMGDGDILKMGASADLQIYHDGSASIITDVGTGDLRLLGNNLKLGKSDNSATYLYATEDGSVELYYAGAKKLETASSGVTVTGVITTDGLTTSADINFGDNDKAVFGAGSDLQIYHDGSNSIISDEGTGGIKIFTAGVATSGFYKIGGEELATFEPDGPVTLYHNDVAKLATTSTGIKIGAGGHPVDTDADDIVVMNTSGASGITISAQNNSVSSLRFGDSDLARSGMFYYNHNDNYLRIDTSGTERMRIDSSGTIKSSVNGSNANLILDNDADTPYLRFDESSASKFTIGEGSVVGGASGDGFYDFYAVAGIGQRFFTNAAERMRITSAGLVGIGTSGPVSQMHLSTSTAQDDAHGQLKVVQTDTSGGASTNAGINVMNHYGTSQFMQWEDNGLRIGSRILTNSGVGNVVFTAGADSEKMRIDASGNVIIGASTSNIDVAIGNTGTVGHLGRTGSGGLLHLGGDDCQVRLQNSILHHDNSGNTNLYLRNHYTTLGNDNAARVTLEAGTLVFATSTSYTERMRINSNGSVEIGSANNAGSLKIINTSADVLILDRRGSDGTVVLFRNDDTNVGGISVSGSGVVYNTTSDYRLKENVESIENGLERLNQLNPVKFDWKEDGTSSEGFIAHEVQEIFPDAVSGEKDAETMQGMDYGRITPLLVKAIQEQQTLIESLTARIETLEG